DHQLAEDTFQVVFLVLARRAHSIRDPDLLSNWLYGVALRTARKAGTRLARRRKSEEDCAMTCPDVGLIGPADQPTIEREQAAALAPRSASASVSSLLCDATARAAIRFAAHHAAGGALSAPVAALAREVLLSMLLHKLRLTAMSLLLLAAVTTGAGWLARSTA